MAWEVIGEVGNYKHVGGPLAGEEGNLGGFLAGKRPGILQQYYTQVEVLAAECSEAGTPPSPVEGSPPRHWWW